MAQKYRDRFMNNGEKSQNLGKA